MCAEHNEWRKTAIWPKKKNSSVFAEPKDPNLTANGGNGYDHKDRQ